MKMLNKLLRSGKPVAASYYGRRYLASDRKEGHTIVDTEITKFNEMAEDWWNPGGPMKALHLYNNLRVPFIRECILSNKSLPFSSEKSEIKDGPYPLKGYKLIDVGCGAGILSEALAKIGADVTGLDAGAELVVAARKHASLDKSLSENLRYVNNMIENHAAENDSKYDALVCSEVLEHVNDPDFFVEQCTKLGKPGGSLVFSTINKTFLSWFYVILLAEYVTRSIPVGTHHYKMLIRHENLERMFQRNNCDVRRTEGTITLPNGYWRRIPTNSLFYVMHAVKNL